MRRKKIRPEMKWHDVNRINQSTVLNGCSHDSPISSSHWITKSLSGQWSLLIAYITIIFTLLPFLSPTSKWRLKNNINSRITAHKMSIGINSSSLGWSKSSSISVKLSLPSSYHSLSSFLPISSRRISRKRALRVMAMATTAAREVEELRTRDELKKGIAELYDESSGIWEDIWGDHMHHGYYDASQEASLSHHKAAQIRMIEEALRFAGVSDDPSKKPKQIVDVGCGIGGSSRYLAKKYGATCQGITLSPIQAQRAQALAASEGLADKAFFQVADALEQPFPDGQFDLVWSMESGEHMPDKRKFVNELVRVAAPGGTIILVTWCHRDLSPSEESLTPKEKELLRKICDAYYLPAWCSAADYVEILESLSLQDIKAADWSENVAPFWPAVIRTALTWKGLTSLIRSGWKTVKGALAMPLMVQGYEMGLIKFAIITCRKPE